MIAATRLILISILLGIALFVMAAKGRDAEELYRLAERLTEEGRYALAAEQYRSLLAAEPHSARAPAAQWGLACSLDSLASYGEAAQAYGDFAATYQDDERAPRALVGMARALVHSGEVPRGVGAYLRTADRYPDSPEAETALFEAAAGELLLERPRGAVRLLGQLLEEYPKTSYAGRARLQRGFALRDLGRFEEAKAEFAALASTAPPDSLSPYALLEECRLTAALGDSSRAAASYGRLLKTHAGTPVEEAALAEAARLAAARRRWAEAESFAARLASLYPKSPHAAEAYSIAGTASLELGDLDAAQRAFEALSHISQDEQTTLAAEQGSAEVHLLRGVPAGAVEILESRRGRSPTLFSSSRLDSLLSVAYRAAGEPGEAAVALERLARSSEKRDVELLAQAGSMQLDAGNWVQAIRIFEECAAPPVALRLWADSQMGLGLAYEHAGDQPRALHYYRLLLDRVPYGEASSRARRRVEIIEKYAVRDPDRVIDGLVDVIVEERSLLEAARMLAHEFRAYERAVSLYQRAAREGGIDASVAYIELGTTHRALAAIALYGDGAASARAHREEARRAFLAAAEQAPGTDVAVEAEALIIELALEELTGAEREAERARLCRAFLPVHPQGGRSDWALAQMARGELALGGGAVPGLRSMRAPDPPHLETAVEAGLDLLAHYPESAWRPEAMRIIGAGYLMLGHVDAGQHWLEALYAAYPREEASAWALDDLARFSRSTGDWERVRHYYDALLAGPVSEELAEEAMYGIGESAFHLGSYEQASRECRRFIELFPRSALVPEAIYLQGLALARQGAIDQALDVLAGFENAYPDAPRVPHVLLARGDLLMETGRERAAASWYSSVAEAYPGSPAGRRGVVRAGDALFAAGEFEDALAMYERAGSEGGPEERAPLRAGLIASLYRMGMTGRAEQEVSRFVEEFGEEAPGMARIRYERGRHLLERGQTPEALAALQAAVEAGGSSYGGESRYMLGLARMRSGDLEGAIETFGQVREEFSGIGLAREAAFKTGSCLYGLGRFEEAAAAYRSAAGPAGQEPPFDDATAESALYNLAVTFRKLGDLESAIRTVEELLGRFPDTEHENEALLLKGGSHQDEGDCEAALAAYRSIVRFSSDEEEVEVRFWMAECLLALGDPVGAASEFLSLAYQFPGQALWAVTAEFRAGLAYEEAGMEREAIEIYQGIIADRPEGDEWAREAQERLEVIRTEP